jgi:hypothetical protein
MGGNCDFTQADKSPCTNPATHHWGPVKMCCRHFDQFASGLLDLKDAVRAPRHLEIVEEYNRQTHRSSSIEGEGPGTKNKCGES